MFPQMIHRTLKYIFSHKSTRKLLEKEFVAFLEDERTRKVFEEILEKCLLEYCSKTGYGEKL